MAECLKTLGLICADGQCPGSCGIVAIAEKRLQAESDGSRETMEKVAQEIANKWCPENVTMVLSKGSKRLVW